MILFAVLSFFHFFSNEGFDNNQEISNIPITNSLGVPPFLAEKYEQSINSNSNTFTCFDGSKTIGLSEFNNNYCDCSDCSDEPGSPATSLSPAMTSKAETPNGAATFNSFYCQNPGYVPSLIPRWSVGDGICDCCDGADEVFNNHSRCVNTCAKLEKSRIKLAKSIDRAYKAGNQEYHRLVKEGEEHKIKAQTVYNKYHPQIEKLNQAKDAINSAKERPTPTPTPEPQTQSEEQAEDEQVNEENESNSDQVYSEKVDDQSIENQIENQNAIEETIDYENNGTNCSQTIDKDFFYSFNFSFCIDESENPYPNGLTYTEKNERRDAISNAVKKLEDEMNSEESFVKYINQDNIPPQFLMLSGQEFKQGEFKFTFLEEIKESYSSLGKFNKYENGELYFDNGAYCWETRCGKKTWMKLVCSSENALIKVTEALKCEYRAIFATPAVCTDEYINKANELTVDQLETIKEETGL